MKVEFGPFSSPEARDGFMFRITETDPDVPHPFRVVSKIGNSVLVLLNDTYEMGTALDILTRRDAHAQSMALSD